MLQRQSIAHTLISSQSHEFAQVRQHAISLKRQGKFGCKIYDLNLEQERRVEISC